MAEEFVEGVNFDIRVNSDAVSASEVSAAIRWLWDNSPTFKLMTQSIHEMDGKILIDITEGGLLADTSATQNPSDDPGYDTRINLPTGGFDGDGFPTTDNEGNPDVENFSLVRSLGHEMFHAWIDVFQNNVNSTFNPTRAEEESDALDIENKIAAEIGLLKRDGFNQDEREGEPLLLTPEGVPLPPDTGEAIPVRPVPSSMMPNNDSPANNASGNTSNWFGQAFFDGSPLVFDLDGDGIELSALENSTIAFDFDGDGFAEQTGWLSSDDGFLTTDLNGDGRVNDITELFGTDTNDGFSELALHDDNGDNVIDANDSIWNDLRIWVDENQNGFSEDAELFTLDAFNINSINLAATLTSNPDSVPGHDLAGNSLTHLSSYTTTTGETGIVGDVWFEFNNVNTNFIGGYTPDLRTLFLPTIKGAGTIADMHIAASMDNDNADPDNLMDQLIAFTSRAPEEFFTTDTATLDTEIETLLFRWAGVQDIDPTSRGSSIDARKLAFLEKFNDAEFLQYAQANPLPEAASRLTQAFDYYADAVKTLLIFQSTPNIFFNDNPNYNVFSGNIEGALTLSQEGIDLIEAQATASATPETIWTNFAQFVGFTVGFDNLSAGELAALDAAVASSGGPALNDWQDAVTLMENLLGPVFVTPGDLDVQQTVYDNTIGGPFGGGLTEGLDGVNDRMGGSLNDDIMRGLSGDDRIDTFAGDDTLDGGAGNDYLLGGRGNDTYIYNGGTDTIQDIGADADVDEIIVEASTGLTLTDITSLHADDDANLVISFGGGEGIVIDSQFARARDVIESLTFELDGSSLDLTNLPELRILGDGRSQQLDGYDTGDNQRDIIFGFGGNDVLNGGDGDDDLFGGQGFDRLNGEDGNDFLDGGANDDFLRGGIGDDTLAGGTGNDVLWGESGNDTYVFNLGDGHDTIRDTSGVMDALRLGPGITPGDVIITGMFSDAEITFANSPGDKITILGQADDFGSMQIEKIIFDDGTEIPLEVPNIPPDAQDDEFVTDVDTPIEGNVLANDIDPDGNGIFVVSDLVSTTAGGDIFWIGEGDFFYIPPAGFSGVDTAEYVVEDFKGAQDTATITITVGEVNTAPDAQDDNFRTDEDVVLTGNVLANDTDPDGDAISVLPQTVSTTAGGSIVFLASGNFTYSPPANFNGTDSVDYTIEDSNGAQDTATLTITVNAVNDGPVAQDDSFTTDEDLVLTGNLLTNDSDVDGDALQVQASTFTTAAGGMVELFSDGSFTYTPAMNFFGNDSFDYTVLDGNGGSDTATANITINPVNDGPVAQDDAFTGEMGDDITGNVLTNDSDVDGDVLQAEAATLTTVNGGTVVMLSNGDFTYTPDPMFDGVDMFDYNILDGNGGTATATVTLTVEMPEDAILGTNRTDFLFGTRDDDVILGKGGRDFLFGRSGDDMIDGGAGNDKIFGGRGDDMLEGGSGRDWLFGNSGDDILNGGAGRDTLYGGRGADTFVFKKDTAFDGVDDIRGFKLREGDALDISDILEEYDPLTDALSDFVQVQRSGFFKTEVRIDVDGAENGHNFETIAVLQRTITNLDEMVDNGALVF